MKFRLLNPEEILQVGDEFREFTAGEDRPGPEGVRGHRPEVWTQTRCVGLPARYPDFYRRPAAPAQGASR